MEWSAEFNDRSYRRPAIANTFCIARAGESAVVEYANADLSFVHFYLPTRWFDCDELGLASNQPEQSIELIDPMNGTSHRVGAIARSAARIIRSGKASSRLQIEAATMSLAATLVDRHSTARLRKIPPERLSPRTVRRITDHLHDRLADQISLMDCARIAGLTAPHFCRAFTQAVGMPPHRYQIMLRIDLAQHCLSRTNLAVAEIGAAVGYDDAAYFSRIFKLETGFTPSAWRREALR